jgi:hypothetical protein
VVRGERALQSAAGAVQPDAEGSLADPERLSGQPWRQVIPSDEKEGLAISASKGTQSDQQLRI